MLLISVVKIAKNLPKIFLGTKRDHNISSQNTTRIIQKLCTQCATALGARAGMVQAHTASACMARTTPPWKSSVIATVPAKLRANQYHLGVRQMAS